MVNYGLWILNGDRGGFAARMGPRRRGVPTLGRTAGIDAPLQAPRGSAKEGSTVVSTVKDTGAATSSMPHPTSRPHPARMSEPQIGRINTNNAKSR